MKETRGPNIAPASQQFDISSELLDIGGFSSLLDVLSYLIPNTLHSEIAVEEERAEFVVLRLADYSQNQFHLLRIEPQKYLTGKMAIETLRDSQN